MSLLSHTSCSNKKKKARENILKFSKSPHIHINTMKFGFPLTNNDEGTKDGKENLILTAYTSKNLIDMDEKIPPELPKPEYIVDFSKDPLGELIIYFLILFYYSKLIFFGFIFKIYKNIFYIG